MPTAIRQRPIENTEEVIDLQSLIEATYPGGDADDEDDEDEPVNEGAPLTPFHCDGTRRDPLQEILDSHFEQEDLRVSKYLIYINFNSMISETQSDFSLSAEGYAFLATPGSSSSSHPGQWQAGPQADEDSLAGHQGFG